MVLLLGRLVLAMVLVLDAAVYCFMMKLNLRLSTTKEDSAAGSWLHSMELLAWQCETWLHGTEAIL